MDRIAYFSPGLRPLEPEIGLLSGMQPSFRVASTRAAAAVAGWGHKPSAGRARRLACNSGLPYIAFEDGFLRSLRPGPQQRPVSMVADRSGIYYDARGPSDLETLLAAASFEPEERARARDFLHLISRHRLSKYNHGLEETPPVLLGSPKLVLIIDQTFGDASVAGALADGSTFRRMAEAARAENPDATVVARLHPETVSGAKRGYLSELAEGMGLKVCAEPVSPWRLIDRQPHVYTVSSQFGFEALLAGCRVTCFGVPFYAGWGLTDDRGPVPARRGRQSSVEDLAAAVYLRYAKYFDCWQRGPVSPETAVDQLAFLRRSYLSNARPVIGYRIARWKRRAISAMLTGPGGPPRFTLRLATAMAEAKASGASIAAWGQEAIRLRPKLAEQGVSCIAIEDGFLRSVGLGAAFTEPLSLVFDRTGLYFDPGQPSDLETILREDDGLADEAERAARLRHSIVQHGITKYNVRAKAALPSVPESGGREIILVPGQVADDWAVRIGRPEGFPQGENVNALLLRRVRASDPQAFVIFKPHPDVEKMGRAGRLAAHDAASADVIAHNSSITDLLELSVRVSTFSSLAGFEALLRGLSVTVHGCPFYAGWGLTTDHASFERRGRQRSLDELVAAALIRYPRYWDPVSGLPCPPEAAVERLGGAGRSAAGVPPAYRALLGRAVIWGRRALQAARIESGGR
jgi:capsular polysaccharide export protein